MPLNHSSVAPRAATTRRLFCAAVLTLGLLGTTACGMNVQTNKPYTPGEGVNIDVTSTGNVDDAVHVRNLAIIGQESGGGILMGSMVAGRADALTGVSGKAVKIDGSDGSPLKVTLAKPVEIGTSSLVVLTTLSPLVMVEGSDLSAGLDAVLDLQFREAGKVSVRVPVVDGAQAQYKTITPAPTPPATPTPSATPSE